MRVLLIFLFALYSLSIFGQETIIYPSDSANVGIGWEVGIYGNTAIGSALNGNQSLVSLAGGVYIYEKIQSEWVEKQILTASDAENFDEFGFDIDLNEDYIVIGAPKDDTIRGGVYVYQKIQDEWLEESKLLASDGQIGEAFGNSVNIEENVVIVGARNAMEDGVNCGKVYVFEKVNGIWTEIQKIVPPELLENGRFGTEVSVSEDYLIITGSTDLEDYNFINGRSIHIYEKENNMWILKQRINSTEFREHISLGNRIKIFEDRFITTIRVNPEDAGFDVGAVRVYHKQNFEWIEESTLISDEYVEGNQDDIWNLDIDGNTIVFSLQSEFNSGLTYLFEKVEEEWIQRGVITPTNGSNYDVFGKGLSLHNRTLIAGAPNNDYLGEFTGAIYIYDLDILLDSNEPTLSTQPLQIRPNPAGAVIDVSLKLEHPERIERLEIYKFNGQLIRSITCDALPRRVHQWSIDTGDFPAGLYVLKGIGEERIFTGRLLKVGSE